ncbi:hypothetical protein BH20GEM2_BH20GEM2_21530 [soil metagenome]
MLTNRVKELFAISLIGDGVLALFQPHRHLRLWREGPEPWRRAMGPFLRHPGLTRVLGAAEAGFGIWWASRQEPE